MLFQLSQLTGAIVFTTKCMNLNGLFEAIYSKWCDMQSTRSIDLREWAPVPNSGTTLQTRPSVWTMDELWKDPSTFGWTYPKTLTVPFTSSRGTSDSTYVYAPSEIFNYAWPLFLLSFDFFRRLFPFLRTFLLLFLSFLSFLFRLPLLLRHPDVQVDHG